MSLDDKEQLISEKLAMQSRLADALPQLTKATTELSKYRAQSVVDRREREKAVAMAHEADERLKAGAAAVQRLRVQRMAEVEQTEALRMEMEDELQTTQQALAHLQRTSSQLQIDMEQQKLAVAQASAASERAILAEQKAKLAEKTAQAALGAQEAVRAELAESHGIELNAAEAKAQAVVAERVNAGVERAKAEVQQIKAQLAKARVQAQTTEEEAKLARRPEEDDEVRALAAAAQAAKDQKIAELVQGNAELTKQVEAEKKLTQAAEKRVQQAKAVVATPLPRRQAKKGGGCCGGKPN
jgi:ParB family chromosome partitioning protein